MKDCTCYSVSGDNPACQAHNCETCEHLQRIVQIAREFLAAADSEGWTPALRGPRGQALREALK